MDTAHQFRDMVMAGQGKSMLALAAELGVHSSYFARTFRLSFLCPAITQAILQGRQPTELSANKLNQTSKLAIAWPDQEQQFGFA
jgi:AraC-like DNA-binding protein